MVMLPKEKKKADVGFPKQGTWLVFGAPKIGKTSFAAQWPECLILDMEGGTRYIGGVYVSKIKNLDELREAYAELRAAASEGKLKYKTVALDTIDVVNDWIEREVCEEMGIAHLGQAPFGGDWSEVRKRVLRHLKAFSQLPINVLFISHSRWALVGEVTVGHTIDLPGRLARFALAAVDNILFCTTEKGERKIVFRPYEGIEAGSRNPVLDRAGSCPMSYKALRALFDEPTEKTEKPKKAEKGKPHTEELIAGGVE